LYRREESSRRQEQIRGIRAVIRVIRQFVRWPRRMKLNPALRMKLNPAARNLDSAT
jgi:hypothetical protein